MNLTTARVNLTTARVNLSTARVNLTTTRVNLSTLRVNLTHQIEDEDDDEVDPRCGQRGDDLRVLRDRVHVGGVDHRDDDDAVDDDPEDGRQHDADLKRGAAARVITRCPRHECPQPTSCL